MQQAGSTVDPAGKKRDRMETALLNEILIIFILSIAVIVLCHRFRIPSIVGFLITGVLAGPHGLGLVGALHEVEILAEIGIVLLLFTIGMEFSLKRLLSIERLVIVGGSCQVLMTVLVILCLGALTGRPLNEAIFMGFLVSLSSTAIVLKLLQQRAELESPHGRATLGILIFQDLAVVPMMLLIPLLAGTGASSPQALLVLAAKIAGIVLLVVAGARWIVPQVLFQVARTRNREVFLLTIIVICFAIAWATSKAGLSLALGAFLAGLIIAESEYSHEAIGKVIPFRDVFTSFFFVSIGMLLDTAFVFQKPFTILLVTLGILCIKMITGSGAALLTGIPLRTALLAAFALCQIGEFSFILSKTGLSAGLIPQSLYQLFLACSVLSMAATPFIISLAPRVVDAVTRLSLPERLLSGFHPLEEIPETVKRDHLVIIGFGVNGRNVAQAAGTAGISYAVIEMNPETVRAEQRRGIPIYYGDATQEEVIRHVNTEDARIVVVAINDPAATRRITENVRRLAPKVHLIVRTRYLTEMKPLFELGADDVIPEEFETSVEIFSRVLARYLIPHEEIEHLVTEIRSDGYEMLRSLSRTPSTISDLKLNLPDVEISTFRISGNSPMAGKTLALIELRKKYGVSVLAIRRDERILANPAADAMIEPGDILYVLGSSKSISEAITVIREASSEQENRP